MKNIPYTLLCMQRIKTILCLWALLFITTGLYANDITYTVSPLTAAGANDGEITLSVSGGQEPYTITWTNSAGQTILAGNPYHLIGLAPGEYCVVVSDASCCEAGGCITVETCSESSGTPTVTMEVSNASSPTAGDGGIDVTIEGNSTGNYDIQWYQVMNPGGFPPNTQSLFPFGPFPNPEDLDNMAPGRYCIRVTDLCGHTAYQCADIESDGCEFELSAEVTPISCDGQTGGAIDLIVSGATNPLSFSWSNGASTEDLTDLFEEGYYQVTVSDNAGGCTVTQFFSLFSATIEVSLNAPLKMICNENEPADIDINVEGCTSNYGFQWSTGATTEDLMGITEGGLFCVTISDLDGCCDDKVRCYMLENAVAVHGDVKHACENQNNGAIINLSASSNDDHPLFPIPWSYHYDWQPAINNGALAPGEYCVTVSRSFNGNESLCYGKRCFTIESIDPAVSVSSTVEKTCFGESTGSICLEGFTGGQNQPNGDEYYVVEWSNGEYETNLVSSSTSCLDGLAAGNYSVTIYDWTSCTSIENFTVENHPEILISLNVIQPCPSQEDGSVEQDISGGVPPYTFSWSNGTTSEDLTNIGAGEYSVTVTDDAGCKEVASITVTENVIAVEYEIWTTCIDPDDGSDYETGALILSSISGGSPPYQWLWDNGSTEQDQYNLGSGFHNLTITDGCGDNFYTYNVPTQLAVKEQNFDEDCAWNVYCYNESGNTDVIEVQDVDTELDWDNIVIDENSSCPAKLNLICPIDDYILDSYCGEIYYDYVTGTDVGLDCEDYCNAGEFCIKETHVVFNNIPGGTVDKVVKNELSTIVTYGDFVSGDGCTLRYYCGEQYETGNPPFPANEAFHDFEWPGPGLCSDLPNPYYPCRGPELPVSCTGIIMEPIPGYSDTYRLKLLDKNDFAITQSYPNPTSNVFYIDLVSSYDQTESLHVEIVDLNGRNIRQLSYDMDNGSNTLQVTFDKEPPGIYQLYITDSKGQRREVLKVVYMAE